MADNSKLIAGGSVAVGSILLWSAINNKKALATTKNLVSGQKPVPGPESNPFTTSSNQIFTGGVQGTGANSIIAQDALQYQGTPYVWGGKPGTQPMVNGIGPHDCSSMCNWVCGHDLSYPIPFYSPGTYDGSSHGPPTSAWLLWGGLKTISHNGDDAEAGDLCIWQTHMGIAIGGGRMISAQNPQNGTKVSGINGFISEALFIRRYKLSATGA